MQPTHGSKLLIVAHACRHLLLLTGTGGDVDTKAEEDKVVVDKKERSKPTKKMNKPPYGEAAAVVTGSELADEWADAVKKKPQAQAQPVPLPLPSSVSRTLVRGDFDEARQPQLKQPRSASSAASSAPSAPVSTPYEASTPKGWTRSLMVGNLVKLFGLSRQELNGQVVRLLSFDGEAERWAVQLQAGGDPIQGKPGNLKEVDRA